MLTALDHVVIAVRDVDAAAKRYTALLGRTPSWAGEHPGFGTRNVLFRLDNTYIELLAAAGPGPVADSVTRRIEAQGEGLFALALGCADAEAAMRTLRERGLQASEPVAGIAHDAPSGAFRRFRNVMLPPSDTAGIGLFVIEHLSDPDELPPALPLGDVRASAAGVDHVVIMTPDPERALKLYGEQLGIRLALDRSFEKRGVRLLFFRLGGATIEIAASLTEQPSDAAGDDRFWGMALQVPDIELAHARMLSAGLELSSVRDGHKAGTRVFSVKGDPLGVPTLVIQPIDR